MEIKRGFRRFQDSGVAGRFCRKLARTQGYKRERLYDETDPYHGNLGVIAYAWVKEMTNGIIEMRKVDNCVSFKRFYR